MPVGACVDMVKAPLTGYGWHIFCSLHSLTLLLQLRLQRRQSQQRTPSTQIRSIP